MTSVRSWLIGILTTVYRPVEKMALEVWAEANIVLRPKESQDNHGPYKRIHAPYAPRVLDEFMNNPEWKTLVVEKSSQSGFTLHVLILICRLLAERMINIIYSIDSKETARDLSRNRLQPMLEDCKATALTMQENDEDVATLSYNLPRGQLWLVGATNAAQGASKPAGFVAADELEKQRHPKNETHFWYLLINRIKRKEGGKAVGFSTPTTETGITHVCFIEGSQHRYFVPCPHCRRYQVIEWKWIRWDHCRDERGNPDLRKILVDTYLECADCHERIDEDHKPDMMLAGDPRPTNFREETIDGEKRQVPAWPPGAMSFHISDLYSLHPESTWGHIAVEYVLALDDQKKMHDWLNGRMGAPFKQTVSEVGHKHILRLKGDYLRGTCPVVPCIAAMSIDNQGDHIKWLKYVFLPNGSMYVVDWGKGGSLEEADELVKVPIKGPEGREFFVQRVIVDEGGKGGTSYEVRKFCFTRFPMFFPCKGRGGIQVKNTIWWSNSSIEKGGNEQMPVCHFDDDAFKRELYIGLIKKFDAVKVRDFNLPRLFLPENLDQALVRELCGEQLVKQLNEHGVPEFVWVPKPPNDYGDGAKMGRILWNIIGSQFQPVNATTPPGEVPGATDETGSSK